MHECKSYYWDEPNLYKRGSDQILRLCVLEVAHQHILSQCHDSLYGGHFRGQRTATKVLQSGYFWPTLFKDARDYLMKCDRCQRTGNISWKNAMAMNIILELELFDVWGIEFMGSFPPSNGHKYILLVVDYVSKWVEAVSCIASDATVVSKFLRKNIFTRFGTRRAIISDEGSHFVNNIINKLLHKYNIHYKVAAAYHPQTTTKLRCPIGKSS